MSWDLDAAPVREAEPVAQKAPAKRWKTWFYLDVDLPPWAKAECLCWKCGRVDLVPIRADYTLSCDCSQPTYELAQQEGREDEADAQARGVNVTFIGAFPFGERP